MIEACSMICFFEVDVWDGNQSAIECTMNNLNTESFTSSLFQYFIQTRTERDWARSNSAYQESSPKIHLHDFNMIQIGDQKYMSIPANLYYETDLPDRGSC